VGIIPSQGSIAVPLHQSRDGILMIQPVVSDFDYQWCGEISEGISLSQIHDGSVRITQMVDMKFQRLFGASFPGDTTLFSWYACANDVDGVLWQGALYVTDYALCHYSNLIGGEMKMAIELKNIVSMRKVNTALVFPNAIEVKTTAKTFIFRTFHNRADAFRSILKALPNKKVAVRDDDVDDRAKHVFNLPSGDVILVMHPGMLHDGEGLEGVMDAVNGYILLTTHHLLFMTTDFIGKIKMPWAEIENLEKKTSMMVRNNAVLAQSGRKSALLSSSKWNRDKVFDEDMAPLWNAATSSHSGAAADVLKEKLNHFADHGTRCRTMTCNIVRAHATMVQKDPADKNTVYSRQKLRAKDSLTWTVALVDAVTKKVGADRTVGNPCIIQLHAPWVVDNFSSTALEVQFVDQTRSCVVSLEIAGGETEPVLGVDLRREVFLRLRMPMVRNKVAGWSEGFLIHTDSGKNEFEGVLELPDADGHSQPVVVEIARDTVTCGFRVTLYNRYWMLNLTGLPLVLRKAASSSLESTSRILPIGSGIGYDVAAGHDLEMRVKGFQWSAPFSVDRNAGDINTFKLSAMEGQQAETAAVPNQEVSIDVSSSTASAKFDRTIIITFAPEIVMENHFGEPLVIWQRATNATSYERNQRPTLWLEPGQALPFYPEGDRNRCRLSVNLAAEDISGQCAAFAAVSDTEPILLKTSDGRVLVAHTQRLSANTATIVVRFQQVTCTIPHKITNHTGLMLAFKQKDSRKNLLLRVHPYETISMVWPDPLLPKELQIVEIQGHTLPTVESLDLHKRCAVDLDSVQIGATPLFDTYQTMLVKKLMEHHLKDSVTTISSGAPLYVLRLANPQDSRMQGCEASTFVIQLRDFHKFVLGRDPIAEDSDEYCLKLGNDTADTEWHGLISRRHVRLMLKPDGGWLLEDLASTNGVYINEQRLVSSCVLQEDDLIRIGGTNTLTKGTKGDAALDSPLVYVFEKMTTLLERNAGEACVLHANVQLDGGTKVMHLTCDKPKTDMSTAFDGRGSMAVSLKSSGLRFIIEDDDLAKTEEVLFLQLDNVNAMMRSDAQVRQVSLTFLRLQLDNQFDALTPFPVVISIAPKDSAAFKVTVVEKLGQPGVGNYYKHVLLEVGDPYIFAEDRLIAKIAGFLSKFKQQQALRQTQSNRLRSQPSFSYGPNGDSNSSGVNSSGVSTPKSAAYSHCAMPLRSTTQEGVREDLATLVALICNERVSGDVREPGDAGPVSTTTLNSDAYVYIDELKWRAWKVHLTLMLTGDDNKVLRRYCGRVVERMLRKIRLDDVVVSMAAIDKVRQLRTQRATAAWLSKKMMDSAKKSFFSSKFLFKGLDGFKDAFLGKQLDTQMAHNVALVRLRPLEISDEDCAQLRRKPLSSVSFSTYIYIQTSVYL